MVRAVFILMAIFIVTLSTGCNDEPDQSLCTDYVDSNGGLYSGFIFLTENNLPAQIPVTVNITLEEGIIEISINNGLLNLHDALHRYNCVLLEDGTVPYIEISNSDGGVIGSLSGAYRPIFNYDLEVVPNATSTTASLRP